MSVKVPPKGSRGVPIPRFLAPYFNRFLLSRFRRGGLRTRGGLPTLLLETIGARSGKPRQAALGYLEEDGGSWLVIASAGGGSRHPAWLHNLARQPDVTIEFENGQRMPVRAESPEGADLEAAWERIARDAPEYAGYRSKTDREIPVVRLRAR